MMSLYGDDSISAYEEAAHSRFEEALLLMALNRRSAAAYLLGYVAEMLVKAAGIRYFFGHGPATPVTPQNRKDIADDALLYGVRFRHSHDACGWADWLIKSRAAKGTPYAAAFASELFRQIGVAHCIWEPAMRYRDFEADVPEAAAGEILSATRWLVRNYHSL